MIWCAIGIFVAFLVGFVAGAEIGYMKGVAAANEANRLRKKLETDTNE